MRRVRDRHLPDPLRTWINRDEPLPQGVTVLPRTINVSSDVWRLVCVGFVCAALCAIFIALIVPSIGQPDFGTLSFLVLSLLILVGVPLWMTYRLWRTIDARRDQQANTLRQGVLVGPEGVLVRLLPNWCYPIPIEQFVKAEEWSSGGSDSGEDYLKIETRGGRIDFVADYLSVGAAEVNQAVASVRAIAARKR